MIRIKRLFQKVWQQVPKLPIRRPRWPSAWDVSGKVVAASTQIAEPPSNHTLRADPEQEAFIRLVCPSCGKKLAVTSDKAGKAGRCPCCGQKVQVPHPTTKTTALVVIPESPRAPEPVLTLPRQPEGPLPIPRFIEGGALIKCSGCNKVLRINEDEDNRRIQCECNEYFRVVVAPDGYIPVRCRLCACDMEISDRAVGLTTRCMDCNELVHVPDSPIVVRPAKSPAKSSGVAAWTVVAILALAAVASDLKSGPRRCIVCGRNIRNPSPYCHLCRPR
jgi:hypothetical protein